MLVIGIAGGSGSGKTTVALAIAAELGQNNVAIVSQDSYYYNHPGLPLEQRANINYDHPNSFENSLLFTHLNLLRSGKTIQVPTYDYVNHLRLSDTISVSPKPVVLVEGLLVLADQALRSAFDLKLFVDVEAGERALRRAIRDVSERGRTLESVYNQYLRTVKTMHETFVEPSKQFADIVITGGGYNVNAVKAITPWLLEYVK